jgi:hypothetical protein
MTSIKIECGCGQRYAFDVEPANGCMPYTVACPICGADGTGVANEVIAQSVQPVAVAAPGGRSGTFAPSFQAAAPAVRVVQPAVNVATAPANPRTATHARTVLLPGQTDPTQVAHEARAKIFWGDPPQEVLKFLLINNVPRGEAMEIIRELTQERVVQMRKNGLIKIFSGILMICVPIGGWFGGMVAISIKLFAFMVMLGLWGFYRLIKGILMVVAPKMQQGDVSEQ